MESFHKHSQMNQKPLWGGKGKRKKSEHSERLEKQLKIIAYTFTALALDVQLFHVASPY